MLKSITISVTIPSYSNPNDSIALYKFFWKERTKENRTEAKKEADFRVIDEWVGQGESVLDLGCGRGILLEHLAKTKQVRGLGVDIDIEKVIGCVSRAVPVYQGDVRKTLAGFPDDSFDWIVFSRTMEELNNPCEVIEKALQVAIGQIF